MTKIYFEKTKAILVTLMLLPFFSFAQINLLQTTNNNIAFASLVCQNNNVTSSNSFGRLYNLNSLGYSSFQVTKVSFAVYDFQLGTAPNFPVIVSVYSSTGGTADANLTLAGQATVNITSAMAGTIVEVPFSTPANVSSPAMFIVLSAPDGIATTTKFRPGANSNGQTAPGYIRAVACGASNFTSFTAAGDANNHLILFPTGNPTGVLGVENLDSLNKMISIYPNPVKSISYFSEEVYNIKITDLAGRTVKQISASSKSSIDLSALKNGTYIINATTKNGTVLSKKVIKE